MRTFLIELAIAVFVVPPVAFTIGAFAFVMVR